MDKKPTLSAEKQALLDQRLKGVLNNLPESKIAPSRIKDEPAVLSYAQQHLWIVDQMQPGNPAYNVPVLLEIKGDLDVLRLESSFNEVIKRHEVLRTSFITKDNQPYQIIHPELKIKIEQVDLSALAAGEKGEKYKSHISSEVIKPFNLGKLPLIRLTLYKMEYNDYKLLLNLHHIVADGWSVGLIIQEAGAIYDGNHSDLTGLPIQYADYSILDKKRLEENNYEKQISYWKEVLNGELPVLELPLDKPRPVVQTFVGSNRFFSIDKSLTEKLLSIGLQQRATFFMLILAAYQVLLHRYSGQDDIVVGVPVSTRTRNEYEKLVGYFLNMNAFRIDLSDDPTFTELLKRVREITIGAFSNQELPFEKVVENLKFKRDISRNPVFQTTLEISPASSYKLKNLNIVRANLDTRFSQVDLAIHLSEDNGEFTGRFEYNTDLFNETTIDGSINHFLNLLTNLAEDPNQNISKIPILSNDEKQELLRKGEQKKLYKQDKTIHQLFEEAAEKWPDSPALSLSGETLTYSELNERANQLAHHIISLGVQGDNLIGICMERSFDLIVGILAILKAGGAYLPIDLSYPHDRTTFMLQDAGVKILLTQSKLSESLDLENVNLILVDSFKPEKSFSYNPDIKVNPENLAYVIYTSGSTGKPKGVMVTHYNVVRLFQATDQWFKFDEHDVWTLFHSYAFDFSVWEIWGALLYGGKLVIVPQLLSRDPESFYKLLLAEKVTVLNQTPSAFRQLVQAAVNKKESEKLLLRYIVFGGEALDLKTLKPWFEIYGDEHPLLINMYGITETTVHVTYRPLSKKDTESGSIIGEPIPDLKLYILDKHKNLVPPGVAGEMYVGGAGVARGYLNRIQLNEERFIKNPFSERNDDRLYRTGDLAKYIDGDDIEYLGRIDHQIKIRGFRIELGEIESVINKYEDVKDSVVIVREDTPEEKRITAYLILKQKESFDILALRNFLYKQLPDYMIPSDFVLLEEFPLTASGKLDKKRLPIPAAERFSERDYITPQNQLEKTIADIWQKYLSLNKIGIDDNFFDLGGHSLMMVKVNYDLKEILKKDISIVDMYRYPTIRTLAEALSNEKETILSFDRISERAKKQKESSDKQKRIKLR